MGPNLGADKPWLGFDIVFTNGYGEQFAFSSTHGMYKFVFSLESKQNKRGSDINVMPTHIGGHS